MPDKSFEEKTEKATPRKRREARKKGQVARSKELPAVTVLISSLISLTLAGGLMQQQMKTMIKTTFSLFTLKDLTTVSILQHGQSLLLHFAVVVGPLFMAVFITAVLANVMQVGFLLSGESIKPKLSKLDPVKGLGRLFSKQSLMELLNALLKLAIVGGVAYWTVRGEYDRVMMLGGMEVEGILLGTAQTVLKIAIRCTLAMILIVIVDYAYRKWEFENRIKMSKKEVKDEFKRTEGDPMIKSRIRSVQLEMAKKRMMHEVPEADMVITNPTHLAVALKYDSLSMNAPKVLAKGAGRVAENIKRIAQEHRIPVMENKPLAQSLYKAVNMGEEIPSSLYQAVAEILATIYKSKGRQADGYARP